MSGTQSKITWLVSKQENRSQKEEKKSSETDPQLTQTSKHIEDLNNAID